MLLIHNVAYAFVSQDLYSSEIEVLSKSISLEQRNMLITEEFAKILKKITGKSNSLSIENIDKYISKYEYKDDKLAKNKVTLKIFFDKTLVNKALIENKHIFLDEQRPLTIIWPKTSTIFAADAIQAVLQKILVLAKDRGLPVIYPILDLQEVEILHKGIIDDNFIASIKQASKRYGADEIIIAECNAIEDILNINWKSIVNNWQFSDQLLDNNQNTEQANLFVDKLTEHFLQLYASNNTNIAKEIILMKISNVINLEDYVQVEKYLKTLAVVNNLHATKFQPGEVEFEIVANGGKQAIQNSISTNNLLQENYNHQSADNTLLYTLNFS